VLDDLQRVVITFQCGVASLLPQENTILMSVSLAVNSAYNNLLIL